MTAAKFHGWTAEQLAAAANQLDQIYTLIDGVNPWWVQRQWHASFGKSDPKIETTLVDRWIQWANEVVATQGLCALQRRTEPDRT